MLIISKYKDYYDYLQGIYGVDRKKVLNRTVLHNSYVQDYIEIELKGSLFHYPETLYLCGSLYALYSRANYDYWWGNENTKGSYRRYSGWEQGKNEFDVVYKDEKIVWIKYTKDREGDKNVDFPYYTLATRSIDLIVADDIPILKHIYFDKVLSPDECYRQIEQYISYKEPEPNSNPDDMNRYESKGFDKKTSFRRM